MYPRHMKHSYHSHTKRTFTDKHSTSTLSTNRVHTEYPRGKWCRKRISNSLWRQSFGILATDNIRHVQHLSSRALAATLVPAKWQKGPDSFYRLVSCLCCLPLCCFQQAAPGEWRGGGSRWTAREGEKRRGGGGKGCCYDRIKSTCLESIMLTHQTPYSLKALQISYSL